MIDYLCHQDDAERLSVCRRSVVEGGQLTYDPCVIFWCQISTKVSCHVTAARKFGRYSSSINGAAYILKPMSTTWVQAHIRHPWFNPYTMKRKISNHEEDDVPPHPTKRRRCSTLERGFAHLSLVHEYSVDSAVVEKAEWVEDVEMPMESVTALTSSESDVNMVAFPSSLKEPTPDIHDVKMRKSTWYEPERDRTLVTSWSHMCRIDVV